MPMLQIELLGDFYLRFDGEAVTSLYQARHQSLLAYLLLRRQAPQLRQHIAFCLWPDSTEAQAKTNLRRELHHLRQLLPHAGQFLAVDATSIGWRRDAPFMLDLAEFQRLLAEAEQIKEASRSAEKLVALEQALNLYRGPLLPSCYDDWILPLREELDQQYVAALEQLVVLLEERRDYAAAIHQAERLLRHDPLHETTYRQLMRLSVLNGDRARALRLYQECCTLLQRELGVQPSLETHALYEFLLQAEAQHQPETARLHVDRIEGRSALVGREQEWQALLAAWGRAQRGQAQLVVVAGEAGIGKTRLAEELLVWAGRQGYLTARSRAYAMEGSLAYAPITELLRCEELDAFWSKLPEVWLVELARLLPEMRDLRPDLPAPPPLQENWQRQRFLEALARAVLAGPNPRMLLLDDLQWCDQETLAWVRYLMHSAAQTRLLLVGTVRIEEVTVEHPLTALRLDLQREGQWVEIQLPALTSEETTLLAMQTAGQPLNTDEAARLYHATEGNPLFVVETVRAGLVASVQRWAGGQPASQPSALFDQPLPPKVHAVIQSRLAQLSPLARELAQLAAAIGRSFRYELLVQASEQGEDDLVRLLDELWQRRILVAQQPQIYDFSHDRIREVAYSLIGPARRAHLHRRIAQALEVVHRDDLDAVAARLAAHFEQAGMADEAIAWHERTAEVHRRLYVHSEAIVQLNAALALFKTLPVTRERDQRMLSLYLALSFDLVIAKGWSTPLVRPVLEQARDLAARLGDKRQLFRVVRELLWFHVARRGLLIASELAPQLLSLAQELDEWTYLADVYRGLARIHSGLGEFAAAHIYVTKAIDLFKEHAISDSALPLADEVGYGGFWPCLAVSGQILWIRGYADQARVHMDEALSLVTLDARPFHLVNMYFMTGVIYRCLNDQPRVTMLAEQMIKFGDKHTLPLALRNGRTFQGWLLAQQGDLAGGIAEIDQAIVYLRDLGHTMFMTYRLALLAELQIQSGQFNAAAAVLEEARSISEQYHEHFWDVEVQRLQGELLRAQGATLDEVEQSYLRALETARAQHAKSLELRVVMSLAQLWHSQGRTAEAHQLLAETYAWFSEGLDTEDLRAARLLLDYLASQLLDPQ